MEIISHVREKDLEFQSNTNHSAGVAELASRFADEFGMSEWGRAIGLLHDKGKEKTDFQNYIGCGLKPWRLVVRCTAAASPLTWGCGLKHQSDGHRDRADRLLSEYLPISANIPYL